MEALDLQPDQSLRCKCPFCNSNENSLSITKTNEGVLYNCFRAKCGERGFISSLPGSFVPKNNNKTFTPKEFTYPLEPLSLEQESWFNEKYHVSKEVLDHYGFRYSPEQDRFVMPIIDRRGRCTGYEARTFGTQPDVLKAISYPYIDTPRLCFAIERNGDKSGTLFVVEDILSAIRVGEYANAVSIMGCTLNDEKIKEILDAGFTSIILTLDRDVWYPPPRAPKDWVPLPIRLVHRYGFYFRNFIPKMLSNKDLKDLTDKELLEELNL